MLDYVLQVDEVNAALSLFSRLFDLRIAFYDTRDRELFLFDVKKRSSYCNAVRNKPQLCALCEESDTDNLNKARATKEILVYHCHRKLFEAIVPLFDATGSYLGALMFGQIRDRNLVVPRQPTKLLEKQFRSLPEISYEHAIEIAQLLKYISEAIIEKAWLKRCRENWAELLEKYIDDHLDISLKLEDLAKAANCSVSFITHNFQNAFGMTPMNYILKRKLIQARKRILEGGKIYEVAQEFAFFDQYHFSRTFRKHFGYPPSQCRKNH